MKIRTITFFIDPASPDFNFHLKKCAAIRNELLMIFQEQEIEVQTTRISTPGFGKYLILQDSTKAIKAVQELEEKAEAEGFTYLSLGPADINNITSYTQIIDFIAATRNCFLSAPMACRQRISLQAIQACAEIIIRASTITSDGFANLRFAATANVQPYGPFFPSSYSGEKTPAFSIAVESADLALHAIDDSQSLQDAQARIVKSLDDTAKRISKYVKPVAKNHKIDFKGFDFSFAPYPNDNCSIGAVFEHLGCSTTGNFGTLGAAAIIASTMTQAKYKKVGLNGLMMPVLEDSVLARRAAEGSLTVKDLLMFSAVCGTGLDTVPLPGDVTRDQISALLLDIAALAVRLGKPLTARLMPVPNRKAGDPTDFNFSFFAPSRIMALPSERLSNHLNGSEFFEIQPRHPDKDLL
jgi:uncharacterized protein (UPF0210 family)